MSQGDDYLLGFVRKKAVIGLRTLHSQILGAARCFSSTENDTIVRLISMECGATKLTIQCFCAIPTRL